MFLFGKCLLIRIGNRIQSTRLFRLCYFDSDGNKKYLRNE